MSDKTVIYNYARTLFWARVASNASIRCECVCECETSCLGLEKYLYERSGYLKERPVSRLYDFRMHLPLWMFRSGLIKSLWLSLSGFKWFCKTCSILSAFYWVIWNLEKSCFNFLLCVWSGQFILKSKIIKFGVSQQLKLFKRPKIRDRKTHTVVLFIGPDVKKESRSVKTERKSWVCFAGWIVA